jgi:hypothetical protein
VYPDKDNLFNGWVLWKEVDIKQKKRI